MYGNQCSGAASVGVIVDRQREVPQAILSAHAEFDALETVLGALLGRLEPASSHKPSDCKDAPSPTYSSDLGNRVGVLTERIASARRRIAQACDDLEV